MIRPRPRNQAQSRPNNCAIFETKDAPAGRSSRRKPRPLIISVSFFPPPFSVFQGHPYFSSNFPLPPLPQISPSEGWGILLIFPPRARNSSVVSCFALRKSALLELKDFLGYNLNIFSLSGCCLKARQGNGEFRQEIPLAVDYGSIFGGLRISFGCGEIRSGKKQPSARRAVSSL